jgi:hypothetical protein
VLPDEKADIEHGRENYTVVSELQGTEMKNGGIDIPDKSIHVDYLPYTK